MSVIGTGPAAGVAQTAHNAQRVARTVDRRSAEQARETRRVREIMEIHLRALDEGDEDTPAQLHVDGQLPEHQSPPQDQRQSRRESAEPSETPEQQSAPPDEAEQSDFPDDEPPTLYRHVDVTV